MAADHTCLYDVDTDQCFTCREHRNPIDVKLDKLQAMAEEAMSFARSIMQEIEDEADDRMLRAEWDADRGA